MEGETKNKNVLFISSENSCINWDNNKAKIYNLIKIKLLIIFHIGNLNNLD